MVFRQQLLSEAQSRFHPVSFSKSIGRIELFILILSLKARTVFRLLVQSAAAQQRRQAVWSVLPLPQQARLTSKLLDQRHLRRHLLRRQRRQLLLPHLRRDRLLQRVRGCGTTFQSGGRGLGLAAKWSRERPRQDQQSI